MKAKKSFTFLLNINQKFSIKRQKANDILESLELNKGLENFMN